MLKKTMVLSVVFVLALFFELANYSWAGEEGLVAYWKFDEGKGDIAKDATNKGNNGKIHGAVWTEEGKAGSALKFDGVDDYVDCGNDASLDITGAITMMAWIKADDLSSNMVIVKKRYKDDPWTSYALSTSPTVARVQIGHAAGDLTSSGFSISANVWYHVAGVYDGTGTKLYINGDLKAKRADAWCSGIITGSASVFIGAHGSRMDNFNGIIDEVRIYNRALSPAAILEHYQKDR